MFTGQACSEFWEKIMQILKFTKAEGWELHFE